MQLSHNNFSQHLDKASPRYLGHLKILTKLNITFWEANKMQDHCKSLKRRSYSASEYYLVRETSTHTIDECARNE